MIEGNEMKHAKFSTALMMPGLLYLPVHQVIQAYIDPGTGSIILQVVIGVLFASVVAIKLFWRQFTAFLGSLFSKSKKNEKHED